MRLFLDISWSGRARPNLPPPDSINIKEFNSIALKQSRKKIADGRGVQLPSACLGWGLPNALLRAPQALSHCLPHGFFETSVTAAADTELKNRKHNRSPSIQKYTVDP